MTLKSGRDLVQKKKKKDKLSNVYTENSENTEILISSKITGNKKKITGNI